MNQRKHANKILNQIIVNGKYANLLMKQELKDIPGEDASFITNIVNGVLRNNRYLNYQYAYLLKDKCSIKDEIILNMAIYEIIFLDNKAYGVINEYVKIAKNKKFINAVLRNFDRNGKKELVPDSIENIGILYSINEWIVRLWNAHYGFEETLKTAESLSKIPVMTYRLNSLKSSFEELEKLDIRKLDGYAFESQNNLLKTKEFKDGKLLVQDYSSQKVAEFLDLKEGLSVFDVCAAPGTKTTQIAQMMNNTGKILANDLHPHRVELIKSQADRLGISNIQVMNEDAEKIELNQTFDRILVDAPCSGLGVIRKKPDIKFRIIPEDLDDIVQIQKVILDNSAKFLKTEGIMVYSTCTLNKKENEKQIQNFLKVHEEFILLEEKTIMPYKYNSDGFYMAKLKKVK